MNGLHTLLSTENEYLKGTVGVILSGFKPLIDNNENDIIVFFSEKLLNSHFYKHKKHIEKYEYIILYFEFKRIH